MVADLFNPEFRFDNRSIENFLGDTAISLDILSFYIRNRLGLPDFLMTTESLGNLLYITVPVNSCHTGNSVTFFIRDMTVTEYFICRVASGHHPERNIATYSLIFDSQLFKCKNSPEISVLFLDVTSKAIAVSGIVKIITDTLNLIFKPLDHLSYTVLHGFSMVSIGLHYKTSHSRILVSSFNSIYCSENQAFP